MKYIKKYNEGYFGMSIEDWCKQLNLFHYTINKDNRVDVDTCVSIYKELSEFPIQFGVVSGYFECNDNKLTTLKGSPKEVKGDFYCVSNYLETLKGGPMIVLHDYHCGNNKLISLEGFPKKLGGGFKVGRNPIYYLYSLFNGYKDYQDSLDYNYLHGTNIIKHRFEEALEEIEKEAPKSIPGYKYI